MTTRTQALEDVSALLDKALDHLRSECVDGDRIDPQRMDARQIPLFDLSLCAAETAAAKALSLVADAAEPDAIEQGLASFFAGETSASLRQRLSLRPAEYGFAHADDLTLPHSQALSSDAIVRLGEALLDLDGSTGATAIRRRNPGRCGFRVRLTR